MSHITRSVAQSETCDTRVHVHCAATALKLVWLELAVPQLHFDPDVLCLRLWLCPSLRGLRAQHGPLLSLSVGGEVLRVRGLVQVPTGWTVRSPVSKSHQLRSRERLAAVSEFVRDVKEKQCYVAG